MPYKVPPDDSDLVWDFFKSGGPGGQHKNKTETAVRLTHLPSGVTVTATERRSQLQNKEAALERLCARLTQLNTPRKKRRPTRPTLASRQKRLQNKTQRGQTKTMRQKVDRDAD